MKVVLIKDVAKLGQKGEVAEVSKGYGVNYLIPQGLAEPGTRDAIQKARIASKQKKEKKEEAQEKVSSIANKVNKKKVQIEANGAKGGRLYASLSAHEVSDMLAKKWGVNKETIEIDVSLAQPIKEAGKYPLDVSISGGEEKRQVEIVISVVIE
jgi:large subunit ribosomal protein L9